MSQHEKLARCAAKELFTSLANGDDFVTTYQLQRQLRIIKNLARHQKEAEEASEASSSSEARQRSLESPEGSHHQGEKLSEAALVSAASSYARGLMPTLSRAVCMVDSSQMELENVPLFHRPFVHPLKSFKWLYDWLIDCLGRQRSPFTKSFVPSNVYTLVLLLVYSLFGTESLVLFVPMAIYYLSFIVMVIATFQMLHSKRELIDFRNWSGLFISYSGGNLNPDEAEYQFCRNNLKPYGHFFLALLLNLMIYPVIAHQWTPQSEFTIIAFVLTLTTLFNFTLKDSSMLPDLLTLFSFGVHVLAKYPYETDIVVAKTWRFLDIRVPTFASYVVGNGIEFCLNFRAVFYLLIPAVFAKMAARDNWKGTYRTLIPHCVTLSWWQIAILSSQGATWYGLIRGTLALVGMVLFLPIAGIASVVLPIVAVTKYLTDNESSMRIAVTVILGTMPFIVSWYLRKIRASRFNWIITYIQVFCGILAAVFLSWPMIRQFQNNDTSIVTPPSVMATLTWEQYQNYCHQPAWEDLSSKVQVQVQCTQLEGIPVSWEGYVTNVRLKSVKNNLENIIKALPEPLETRLACLFGETIIEEEFCRNIDPTRRLTCEFMAKLQKKRERCHLFDWNIYEYEIYVKMKSGIWGNNAEIALLGDHSFSNFSLHIFPGDKIRFTGILSNQGLERESLLGGVRPHVHLEEAGCLVCHTIDLQSYKRLRRNIITFSLITQTIVLGVKTVLNFLLNPLVVFK